MLKRNMPRPRAFQRPDGLEWDVLPNALDRWSPLLAAASSGDSNSISVLDPIGADPWTGEGVSAKRIAGALRSIGPENDVVVNINSPGGDLFEGVAIYNLLREHRGNVTVKVLGMAASAASIVAMAGNEIQIARSGFLMVHNTWVVAMGNRNDLRSMADTLEPFDLMMANIYGARTGMSLKETQKLMDNETWIVGPDAIDQGFADALLPADQVTEDANAKSESKIAAYLLDMALAKAGMPRSERRSLLQDFKAGTPSAAGSGTPSATDESGTLCAAETAEYLKFLRTISEKTE